MCVFIFKNNDVIQRIVDVIKLIKSDFEPPHDIEASEILRNDIELEVLYYYIQTDYNEIVKNNLLSDVEFWFKNQEKIIEYRNSTTNLSGNRNPDELFKSFITEDENVLNIFLG